MNTMNSDRPTAALPTPHGGDTGPIPDAMLDDLRHLLWRMERLPMYRAISVGVIVGALWIAGEVLFFAARAWHPYVDSTSIGLGTGALTILVALVYSPFISRWFTGSIEARFLREVLYSKRLEDLSAYMSVCRMSDHREKIADELLAVWSRHGLNAGRSTQPRRPRPLFK